MSKLVMILGAGASQIPVIKAAKEMGLRVVATDKNPEAPGFKEADLSYPVDITDPEGTLKLARELHIDGVLACGDVSVYAAAYTADKLGLPGLKPEVARVVTDKFLFWEKFKQYGVPYPEARVVTTYEEVLAAIEEISLPVIIKPTLAFGGSRGVMRVNKPEEIREGFDFALQFARNGQLLVEEFLDGIEHTVESLVYKGESYTLAISDKIRISNTYCVGTSLDYPSLFPAEIQQQIRDVAQKVAESVSIENGATHIEMIVTEKGPKVIDFGARGGGAGYIPAVIVPHVSGVNMIQEMLRMAIGEKPEKLNPDFQHGVVYRFFTPSSGKVKRLTGIEEAAALEGVIDFKMNIKVGDVIPPLTTQLQRVGHFVVTADTAEAALRKAAEIERLVNIESE